MKPFYLVALSIIVGFQVQAHIDPILYGKIYPRYAEFCALSPIIKKPGFGYPIHGGIWGHSILYLKGACRDHSASFPQIKMCNPHGKETGVGISSDGIFQNANWTAVEDRNLFFYGGLKPGQPLTYDSYLRAEKKAESLHILRGITFYKNQLTKAPKGMSLRTARYENSMATDYAFNFARNMFCAYVPLSRSQLYSMVHFLNVTNQYYHNQANYNWGMTNNCTTTTDNALAAAGIWNPVPIGTSILAAVGNVAIPMDSFLHLVTRGNDLPLGRPQSLFNRPTVRTSLQFFYKLSTEPGVLAEYMPIHRPNEIYDTSTKNVLLDFPIGWPGTHKVLRILRSPRYTSLRANLAWFYQRYKQLKKERRYWETVNYPSQDSSSGYHAFAYNYSRYLTSQLILTREKIKRLYQHR